MKTKPNNSFAITLSGRNFIAFLFAASLVCGDVAALAQSSAQDPQPTSAAEDAPKIPGDQLDSLVAPIALYPDPLLTQTLVASTYPLEIIQLQQWLDRNKTLKDKKLTEAVSKQPWDPSVQAMAALPDVAKRLADDIQWTTDLGNAFLAQQSDVMDAVQRMRKKAEGAGALKSSEQLKVKTEVVENKTVIVVEQSNPQVVYVPSYNPTVVYGPPVYPYPPIYYPPSTGAVIAAGAISFGVGVAIGAAWGNGGWGWNTGWGNNDVNINVNNNFNRNTNISGGNRVNNIQGGNRVNNIQGGNKWQHNPQHRGGAPYSNRATATKYGGTARGDSVANRQSGARQQLGRQGGNLPSTRDANRGGLSDRAGSAGNRAGVSDRASGIGDRGADRGANRGGVSDRSSGIGDRGGSGSRGSASDRVANMDRGSGGNRSSLGGGGGERIGNRDVSRGSGSRAGGSFGGGGGSWGGGAARASSSRGASSMGGGGGRRGGGGGFGGRRR